CVFYPPRSHLHLLSFPTRRSSDLVGEVVQRRLAPHQTGRPRQSKGAGLPAVDKGGGQASQTGERGICGQPGGEGGEENELPALQDRKSTRLNSSHVSISYAVFCLK